MTRINVGIKPKDLHYKHLIAEHREIKRIPNMIISGKAKIVNIPNGFSLGTGHVKFFYNKLGYLKKRYEELYKECLNRNFKVTYYGDIWDDAPKELMNDWLPTIEDILIIKERINKKLNG